MEKLKPVATERRRQMRNDIYRYIFYSKEPVSKQQIANALNVSRPTVLQNLLELEEAGLVEMAEIRESQGGRPPAAYVAKGDIKMALGVSLSANQLKFLLSDLKQNVLAYKEIDLEYQTDSDVFAITEEQLEVFLTENHVDRKRLLGVGITIPGVFDENTKNLILSPTIKLKDFRIEEIRKKIPYPLYFENDGISGGVAEWLSRDAEEKKKDFVYLFLEEGVGGATFLNGAPFYGVSHRSAEFGHMKVESNGKICNCGKRGCLEAYCSALRLSTELGITIDKFFEDLEDNPEYQKIWEDVLEHLAVGINNLRLAFDCDVVLGGFLSYYLQPYMGKLKEMVADLSIFGEDAEYIKIGQYPRRAVMMGVAWHFTNEYIENI